MMPGKLKQWAEVHTVYGQREKTVEFDVGIHYAFALKYAIFGGMGIAGAIGGLPALARTTDELFSIIICGLLALVSFATAVAVLLPKRQELEVYLTLGMMILLGVLGVALFLRYQDTGDAGRLYLSIGAMAFIVFPLYRSAFIAVRLRRARKLQAARARQTQLMHELREMDADE
jgi:hypothetical protein